MNHVDHAGRHHHSQQSDPHPPHRLGPASREPLVARLAFHPHREGRTTRELSVILGCCSAER
jgi:hypothetical protein